MVVTGGRNRRRGSIVALQDGRSEQLMIELQAREAWNQRDYATAQSLAAHAAALARTIGDETSWWNATFLIAEALRKQGLMQDSTEIAEGLESHPLTVGSQALSAKVATLKSFALQGSGNLGSAVEAATRAVELARAAPDGRAIEIEAQNALIAALADSDKLEEAWQECQRLADLLSAEPSSQTTGLGYWAIGNVAFLQRHISEAVSYHQLAARDLSPSNDLALWARFNLGSAQFRMDAGLTGPETLECIERAEMAGSIVGGTERDRLELSLSRAQWLVLTGQSDLAIDRLTAIVDHKDLLAFHIAAQAHLLMGQAFLATGARAEAIGNLEVSEGLFLQSGAADRAATARGLLQGMDAALG